MLKIITAFLAAVILGATGLAAAPAASADTRPCLSRSEFRAIKNGMTLTKVTSIVGSKGKLTLSAGSGAYRLTVRSYTSCGSPIPGMSGVSYTGGKVSSKIYL